MKIIEGNISNSVAYRALGVNGKYIRGYCLPDYASKADEVKQEVKEEVKEEAHILGIRTGQFIKSPINGLAKFHFEL